MINFYLLFQNFIIAIKQSISGVIDSWANPSIRNFHVWVILACIICFSLEYFGRKKMDYPLIKRKNFKQDIFYIVFNDFIMATFGLVVFTTFAEFFFLVVMNLLGVKSLVIWDISKFPFLLQFVVLFIAQDFMEYFGHYLLHRFEFLWKFHKIHHAQEELGFASTRHFHWGEYFIFRACLYIPFHFLGYNAPDYFLFQMIFGNIVAFFTHCNLKTNFGFFNYIINNPETHYWHHAKNIPTKHGVNYASLLNIWDVLFKTYYLPKGIEPILGVDDQKDVPDDFWGQMMYPFKKKTKSRKSQKKVQEKKAKNKIR